jgi:hypothetical protein
MVAATVSALAALAFGFIFKSQRDLMQAKPNVPIAEASAAEAPFKSRIFIATAAAIVGFLVLWLLYRRSSHASAPPPVVQTTPAKREFDPRYRTIEQLEAMVEQSQYFLDQHINNRPDIKNIGFLHDQSSLDPSQKEILESDLLRYEKALINRKSNVELSKQKLDQARRERGP